MSSPPLQSTVFIVDDDQAVRDALVWLMRGAQLRAVAFASAEQFLDEYEAVADTGAPRCLVLDVRLPGMSGLELQERLAQAKARLPMVIITGHGQIPMAVAAVKRGAWDFLEKPLDMPVLLAKVREALSADAEPRAAEAEARATRDRLAALTPRERQLVDLIVQGRLNKQIAMELGLSQRTVEKYRASLLEKMGVDSTATLIRRVAQAG